MTHPPIYTMTLDELEARALKGETIVDVRGHLVCSRDRKYDRRRAHILWRESMDIARETGKLPQDRPVNKKGRLFSWSFSALNNFEGCPLRYAQERFYCDVPLVETEAIRYGNEVHEACENALKPAKHNKELVKPVQKYIDLFLKKRDAGALLTPELEIVLDKDLKPVKGKKAWYSQDAWYRGKLDVVLVNGKDAYYYDWKTGAKVKDDQEQLKICCAALSTLMPELETFTPKLIWTKHDTVTGIANGPLTKEDISNIWVDVLPRVQRMEGAWRTENFPARPSGLCRWRGGPANGGGQCPAYDKCEYHR